MENQVREEQQLEDSDLEMFKQLWKAKVPSKVLVLTWQLVKGRLPTKMNLLRRGIGLLSEEQCCIFCKTAAENENHLFLSCDMIYNLWCKIYGWMQYAGAQHGNIQEHFLQHCGLFKGKDMKAKGKAIWFAVIWTIWLERSDAIFNNSKPDLVRMLDLVKWRSWGWIDSTFDGSL